jgi:PPK2 family polyphosphate:nucleotide phosphotransferase
MKSISDKYTFKSGQDLSQFDPNDTTCFPIERNQAEEHLFMLRAEFDDLQELIYAQKKYRILIMLQGTDGSGKDSLIRAIFKGVNPNGCRVINFKSPSEEEMSHNYMWRIFKKLPAKGEIVIHNRTIYEDIIYPSVHSTIDKKVWEKRYEHINAFEKLLTDEGTIVLKFFLHISKKEQKQRLLARLNDPTKEWKVSKGDILERKYWNDYQKSYNNIFKNTSTSSVPWHIIGSNHKWHRNLVVMSILLDTLKQLNIEYPKLNPEVKKLKLI